MARRCAAACHFSISARHDGGLRYHERLFHRERTVEAKSRGSLFETALSLLSYHAVGYLLTGNVPQTGVRASHDRPLQVFQTQDGEISS